MKFKIRFGTAIDGVPYFIHHTHICDTEKSVREYITNGDINRILCDSFLDRKGMAVKDFVYKVQRPRSFSVTFKDQRGEAFNGDIEYFIINEDKHPLGMHRR